jgi:hypothetical protein
MDKQVATHALIATLVHIQASRSNVIEIELSPAADASMACQSMALGGVLALMVSGFRREGWTHELVCGPMGGGARPSSLQHLAAFAGIQIWKLPVAREPAGHRVR